MGKVKGGWVRNGEEEIDLGYGVLIDVWEIIIKYYYIFINKLKIVKELNGWCMFMISIVFCFM